MIGKLKNLPFCSFVLLLLILLAIYAQVAGFDFLRFDDPDYTFANPLVRGGLSPYNICRAFADFRHGAIWMPMTWISYMLDISLFGPGPAAHHLVNLALHLANTFLLFKLCLIISENNHFSFFKWGQSPAKRGQSLKISEHSNLPNLQTSKLPPPDEGGQTPAPFLLILAISFWALHPQRVEAVAWIASRKELLWSCFALLGLIAWWKNRKWLAYGCCALACMSKPTAMVFPLLALLLDFAKINGDFSIFRFFDFSILKRGQSPCERGQSLEDALAERGQSPVNTPVERGQFPEKPCVSNKSENRKIEESKNLFAYLPLLGISLFTALVAIYSQTHPEGMAAKDVFYAGFFERFLNAMVALGLYIWQMIVPIGIHLDYRAVPGGWPVGGWLGLTVFCGLLAIIFRFFDFSIFRLFRKRGQTPCERGQTPGERGQPPAIFAIMWFLFAILPTLGLFASFGEHARADRFLYLPAMALPLFFAFYCRKRGQSPEPLIFRFFDFSILRFGKKRGPNDESKNRRIEKSKNTEYGKFLLIFAVILLFSFQSYRIVACYRNDTSAFERTLACDSDHGRALAHVGEARCAAGKLDEGIELLRRSCEVRPRPDTTGKLAYALMTRGRSADWQEIRLICAPFASPSKGGQSPNPSKHPNLPNIQTSQTSQTSQTCLTSASLRDLKGQTLEALGTAELRTREWKAAAKHLSESILAPKRFYSADDAKLKLAYAWHNGGRRADAKRLFEAISKSTRADLAARADQALQMISRSPSAILFW